MSGVRIFTESPISPAVQAPRKGSIEHDGEGDHSTSGSNSTPADPTSLPSGSLNPQPPTETTAAAQRPTSSPGEPGINPPTPTVTSVSTSTYEPTLQSSSTNPDRSSATSSNPPSPQPGSLPTPERPRSRSASPRRDIPPPPKAGEKMQPASYYSPTPTPTYPQQGSYSAQMGGVPISDPRSAAQPPYTGSYAQNGLLSPHPNGILSPARSYGSPAQTPTTASMQQKNLEHPPGYQQNPYAADMTPDQRFASQRGPTSPSLGYNDINSGMGGIKSPSGMFQGLSGMVSPRPSGGSGGGGGVVGGGILNGDGKSDDGSIWGTVSGWAKGAGKKLSEVEGEVWRRINGE